MSNVFIFPDKIEVKKKKFDDKEEYNHLVVGISDLGYVTFSDYITNQFLFELNPNELYTIFTSVNYERANNDL